MTNYYILKDNEIKLFNEDKEVLQNTILFMPEYKDLEILETNKEIVLFNNKYYFLDDVKNDYIQYLKDNKINELKEYNKNYIYKTYSIHNQIDITMGIVDGLDEMKTFISKCLNVYETMKTTINNKKTIKTITEYNIEEEYNKLIK